MVKHVENVRLVFAGVDGACQSISSVGLCGDAGVVAGSEAVKAESLDSMMEKVKFYVSVAFNAGVWGETGGVAGNIRVDNMVVELVAHVKYMMFYV